MKAGRGPDKADQGLAAGLLSSTVTGCSQTRKSTHSPTTDTTWVREQCSFVISFLQRPHGRMPVLLSPSARLLLVHL